MKKKEICFLELDSNIYSKDAIKLAIYDYSDNYYFKLTKDSTKYKIIITPKRNEDSFIDNLIAKFEQTVLDYDIRLKIEKDFKVLREIILAQAFAPCDNLEEILESTER